MNRRHGRRVTDIRRLAFGLLLPCALALASMPAAGGAATAHRALQGEGDENSYTDPTFGWSIAWDPATWMNGGAQPTPPNDDGLSGNAVAIAGLDPMVGGVFVGSQTSVGGDLAACLDAVTAQVDPFVGGITDVREADLELPEAPADAEQELSFAQFSGYDGALYVECRPLVEDEAVLGIAWILPDAAGYEAALPLFEELLAGLDLSGVHPASEGEGAAKETFTDPLHGWSIAYDPRTWELDGPMQHFADDEDGDRVLTGSGAGFWGAPYDTRGNVYIFGETAYGDDTAACLDAIRQTELEGWPETDVRELELDPPTTPVDADWELYELTSSFVSALYIACLPLVEGESVLSIVWDLGDAESYEAALPFFEELLVGLDLSEVHPAGEAAGGEDASEGEAEEKETFSDPIYGWSIAWDPEAWEAEGPIETLGEDDKPGNEMDFLGRDYEAQGYVRIASLAAPTLAADLAACVEHFRPKTSGEVAGDGAFVDNLREPDLELPDAPPGAGRRLFTFEPLPTQMRYLECRPLVDGEAVLLIDWYLPDAARYEQALPAFEELIAGLDLSEVHPGEDNVADGD